MGRRLSTCPGCGLVSAFFRNEPHSFPFGIGSKQVTLVATIPVGRCVNSRCQFNSTPFTDKQAETIKIATALQYEREQRQA